MFILLLKGFEITRNILTKWKDINPKLCVQIITFDFFIIDYSLKKEKLSNQN